ncbi:hypothetical protein H7D61_14005 [Brucella melitensis]|uniref:hypothetical protein n=2 Tax=Brucella TaxID=234 RepID=UPI0012E99414|nr:hypothetical protein [Brucella melitensis]MBN7703096.1 hypothetical protein [Brucella melitensis]
MVGPAAPANHDHRRQQRRKTEPCNKTGRDNALRVIYPPFIPQAFFSPHVARKNLTGRTGKMATNHQCGHENNNNASRARSTSACYITSVSQDLTLSLMM